MNVNEIRDNYNIRNRGVDKANQNMCYYNCRRKSIKWWKQIFYYGIELAISNSSILYLLSNPQITEMTNLKYKEKLVNDILNEYKNDKIIKKSKNIYTETIFEFIA